MAEAAQSHPSPWSRFRQSLTGFDRSKADRARGMRDAAGVALPLMIGAIVGQVTPALVAATGALNVGFADSGEPWLRVRRMLGATLLVSLAVICGSLSGWNFTAALVTTMLWSFVAGMLVSLGAQAGNIGVSCTCVLLIFASRPLPPRDVFLCGLLALGGGLLQTLLCAFSSDLREYDPERQALGALFLAMAGQSGRVVRETQAPPATPLFSAAADVLAMRQEDHSIAAERFRSLLDQAERLRLSLLSLAGLRRRIDHARQRASLAQLLDQYFTAAGKVLEAAGDMLRTGRVDDSGAWKSIAEAEDILKSLRALPASGETGALLADIQAQIDALPTASCA